MANGDEACVLNIKGKLLKIKRLGQFVADALDSAQATCSRTSADE
jgi:hypothetical protein